MKTRSNMPVYKDDGTLLTDNDLGGGGTEVIANPTLAGTEDALTGLQVGETKYAILQGFHLYKVHTASSTNIPEQDVFYATDNDNITDVLSLSQDLRTKGYIKSSKPSPCFAGKLCTVLSDGRIAFYNSLISMSEGTIQYVYTYYNTTITDNNLTFIPSVSNSSNIVFGSNPITKLF